MENDKIIGFVGSGGGSLGARIVGNLNTLFAAGYKPSVFVGTSTASFMPMCIVPGGLELVNKLYKSVRTEDIIIMGNEAHNLLRDISLGDATPLSDLIDLYYSDKICNEIFASDTQVFLCATCVQTDSSVIFCTKEPPPSDTYYTYIKIRDNDMLRACIKASGFQPVYMQPIWINGRQYVDGGVTEFCGVQIAMNAMDTMSKDKEFEIFAMTTKAPNEVNEKELTKAIEFLKWTISTMINDIGFNDFKIPETHNLYREYIEAVKKKIRSAGIAYKYIDDFFNIPGYETCNRKPITVHHLFPKYPMEGGEGGLEFDPVLMTQWVLDGERDTVDFLAKLKNVQHETAA